MTRQAPEIFKRPLAEFHGTPVNPEIADGILQRIMLDYASRGYTAVVTIDGEHVRGVAVPERGIEPKDYLIGLLQQGFLEDALPSLKILSEIVDDGEVEYNLGLCLSELGKVAESIAPLKRCLALDPDYHHARTALGVSYSRLGQREDAEQTFRQVLARQPEHPHANRNLGALLSRSGRSVEALPLFRKALASSPEDMGTILGLANCLVELGGEGLTEAEGLYRSLLDQYPGHPITDQALGRPDPSCPRQSARQRARRCAHGCGDVHAQRHAPICRLGPPNPGPYRAGNRSPGRVGSEDQ